MPVRLESLDYKPDQETDEETEEKKKNDEEAKKGDDGRTDEKTIKQEGPFKGFIVKKKSGIGKPDGSEPQVSRSGTKNREYYRGRPQITSQEI